jgi:protein-S-isoprenylcysteine O-methyltransferase Ste14
MENRYFLLIILFILCLMTRTGYELFKDSGKIDLENKSVFWIIFAVMCLLWVSWFGMCPIDPYQINLPVFLQWFGFSISLIGLILFLVAFFQLRGLENINHLVTTGLFSKLRHPMYTGFILWILGWSIYNTAPVSFAVGLLGIANILYWRYLEEVRLLAKYGEIYEQYKKTTWY